MDFNALANEIILQAEAGIMCAAWCIAPPGYASV